MLKLNELPDGIVEIVVEGEFGPDAWKAYQDMVWDYLETHDEKCYFLLNAGSTVRVDPVILKEFGTARHLTHPRLGLIALLGTNALQQFILKLTENTAKQQNRAQGLRIHTNRDAALDVLQKHKQSAG